jgi:hypothetical protein
MEVEVGLYLHVFVLSCFGFFLVWFVAWNGCGASSVQVVVLLQCMALQIREPRN